MPCASPRPAARSSRRPVTDAIRPDTVFLPFHWAGELSANLLTNDAHRPGLRDAGVQGLRRAARAGRATVAEGRRMRRRVVVVGHGMVGSRFVEELVAADPRSSG